MLTAVQGLRLKNKKALGPMGQRACVEAGRRDAATVMALLH